MKLILENKSDLPINVFLDLCKDVISMGRVSNNDTQYCYLTAFQVNGEVYHIVSDLNNKSDRLTLYKVPK